MEGEGFGPSQGLCLHRTTQHIKTWLNTRASSGFRIRYPSDRAAASDTKCVEIDSDSYTAAEELRGSAKESAQPYSA